MYPDRGDVVWRRLSRLVCPLMTRTRSLCIPAFVGLLLGHCGSGPTGPSPERYANPHLLVFCRTNGALVDCTATLYDVPNFGSSRDVTQTAVWIVSDPTIAHIDGGRLSPRLRGEVNITARFERWSPFIDNWFLVDPSAPAQRLYFVSGIVSNARTGNRLAGATVTVIAGYNASLSEATNQFGFFRIDRLLVHDSVTLRATREGYVSAEVTSCVTSPVNPPFDPPGCRGTVNFALVPSP